MSKREEFLDSVSTEKVEDFLRFIRLHVMYLTILTCRDGSVCVNMQRWFCLH